MESFNVIAFILRFDMLLMQGCGAANLSGGGSFMLLQANVVAGPMHPRPRRGRLVCEWAPHPTSLLLAAGNFCSNLSPMHIVVSMPKEIATLLGASHLRLIRLAPASSYFRKDGMSDTNW